MILFNNPDKTKSPSHGFTLIEMLVTVAIIGILASLLVPSNLVHRQRAEVAVALRMTDKILEDIKYYYSINLSFPADNKEAGVPEADLLIGNHVTRIEIEDGAVHIVLGNKISKPLQGKTLSIRPAIVTGSPASPISWLCGADEPVPGMEAVGKNKTDLPNGVVPPTCGD